jgi:hypothetical protein
VVRAVSFDRRRCLGGSQRAAALSPASGRQNRLEIGAGEVVADEQQGLVLMLGQRIGEAVTKVEAGRMPPLAEPAESLARDRRLVRVKWQKLALHDRQGTAAATMAW